MKFQMNPNKLDKINLYHSTPSWLFSYVINLPEKYHTFLRKSKHSGNRIKLIKLCFHLIISIDIAEKHFSNELTFPNIILV